MTNDTKPRVYAITGEATPGRTCRWLGMTWNEADAKSAIVTTGATIVGGLVLVMILGLGLVFAHYETHKHSPTWQYPAFVPIALGGALAFYVSNKALGNSWKWQIVPLVLLGMSLFALLVVIGDAAGVK